MSGAGVKHIGNKTSKRDWIDRYVQSCLMPALEGIRVSRIKGKTLFEMAERSRP